jgi:Zn-dependent peptidase ImmA (M78 family)
MSSTEIGNKLEQSIFRLIKSEIDADRFLFRRDSCRVFQKKGYYSQDRKKDIIFDVSVESALPGASTYSMLALIECKNYTHPVPVDDIEEFFAKVQQVAPASGKAIVASASAFQQGAIEFAKSKKIGLLRYFGPKHFKWELYRSPSAASLGLRPDREFVVTRGLTDPHYKSQVYDIFFQTPIRATVSLSNFFEDLAVSAGLNDSTVRMLMNPSRLRGSSVPFVENGDLEARAEETLNLISYSSGPVSLEAICAHETASVGLTVYSSLSPPNASLKKSPLGRIRFDPLTIEVFNGEDPHLGRDRFTLAHELSHHLLGHERFMRAEYCDERDFSLERSGTKFGADISRMEYQANYLASSLLMPRTSFVSDFRRLLDVFDIRDRGRGALFVDNQKCNIDNMMNVTSYLRGRYHVSRAAVRIRLEGLGLLHDVRSRTIAARNA